MFDSVLIANRGAIACRIERTLRRVGVRSIAVYSTADRGSRHVREADAAFEVGAPPATESYLSSERIIAVALESGANAIHPGYGFLSENASFAEACERAGIAFIGPTPTQIRQFGLKHTARALAQENGLPLLPGSGLLESAEDALREAKRIGFPVMLKSTAGGGGIGMQQCTCEADLLASFESVRRLAGSNFSNAGVFIEKFIPRARHVEVQIFGDGSGNVVSLGERDCSMQRRNQKVIEETPAPNLSPALRENLCSAAVRLGRAVRYRSAGTVEFIVDADRAGDPAGDAFYFLEVNTRLQVEHGVTEAVTGVDLVEWMLMVAAGQPPDLASYEHVPHGVAIQARVYAEDAARGFRPSSGLLTHVTFPTNVRVDTWVDSGTEVPPYYDPMLAKIIAHGETREQALARLDHALSCTAIYGAETNREYLRFVLSQPEFRRGDVATRLLGELAFASQTVEVLSGGTLTTVQDWPGRLGYWDVGIPPSGPMDALAFRLANRILGNPEGAPALELTVNGPTLRFASDAVVALSGAQMKADVDGVSVPWWTPVPVKAGAVLRIGSVVGCGQRAYLAVRGAFDMAPYMGSTATFSLGKFGGHGGRALRTGDVLRIGVAPLTPFVPALPASLCPTYGSSWNIAVLYGPHGAPDFFTDEDIDVFFKTEWQVHYNSSRTGVRLIGPRPQWARRDGGEAGLHPSNIHDNAYAVGAIDFTGDMPVILGPDGPSLGGFVCPATVALFDIWKLGQLRPGDRVRFHAISSEEAKKSLLAQDRAIAELVDWSPPTPSSTPQGSLEAVLARLEATKERPLVVYRQSGEDNILIEYGPPVLDLALRFRVQAVLEALRARRIDGLIDMTPGVRSLQVHFDCRRVERTQLLTMLTNLEEALPPVDSIEVRSRIVHLPLSWDDPSTKLAIQKYMQSVRPDAPWCPSNIDFIRRINGLESIEDVRRIIFEASYLVLGLGDVYLGAPVATPLDPRHRLVTTKYNPARTWTPENAVGIGGAYLCVYGMEGPGGYQFVGRTVQMWSRYRQGGDFADGKPWLLRFFDQLRFYEVDAETLERQRQEFADGRALLRIESTSLRLDEYRKFLEAQRESIAAFKERQQAAFEAERERWDAAGASLSTADEPAAGSGEATGTSLPAGCIAITAPVSGSLWQVDIGAGASVSAGATLLVLEAMKMEITVQAPDSGTVIEVRCRPGQPVSAGDVLLVIRP